MLDYKLVGSAHPLKYQCVNLGLQTCPSLGAHVPNPSFLSVIDTVTLKLLKLRMSSESQRAVKLEGSLCVLVAQWCLTLRPHGL